MRSASSLTASSTDREGNWDSGPPSARSAVTSTVVLMSVRTARACAACRAFAARGLRVVLSGR